MKHLILLFFALVFCDHVLATTSSETPRVVRIVGVITPNTLDQVEQTLSDWKNHDPIPGGLIVLLNSPGGNGEAAMKIGRVLRHKNAQAFVIGQCESACVFIFAGGVVRAASSASIGVHAGRLTLTNRNGDIVKEIDSSQSLTDSFKITAFNSVANKYLSEMGIRNGLIDVMLEHQTKQTYKLTDYEMEQFGVVGFDNQYLRKRGDLFEALPKSERLNRIELYNRTLSVPKFCSSQSSNNDAFVKCYRAVLFGKTPL